MTSTLRKVATETVEFTNSTIENFTNTVLDVVTGVIDGTGKLTHTTADIIDTLVHDVAGEHTAQFFKGMGHIAKQLCDELGGVVEHVPLVGAPGAYVVYRAGDAVCHVIVSVGSITNSTARRTGAVVKKGGDLIVFTLAAANEVLKEVTGDVLDLVNIITVGKKRGRSASSKKGRGGSRRQRATRRRTRNVRRARRSRSVRN